MPETRNAAAGVYVSVNGSPDVMVLIPESCQPPMSASSAAGAEPPQRRSRPKGSCQTKLVVLLIGWS